MPHVSLIPDRWTTAAEILEKTQQIAQCFSHSLPIILTQAEFGETYFQCVYLKVTETPELQELAQKARDVFQVTLTDVPFKAHLSMVYDGMDSQKSALTEQQKRQAVQQIQENLQLPLTYYCSGIAIHTSTPVVTEWRQIDFIPFQG